MPRKRSLLKRLAQGMATLSCIHGSSITLTISPALSFHSASFCQISSTHVIFLIASP